MRSPVICGMIRRRVLVNYRADPEVVARHLPGRLRPKLHNGHALVGICLIRLEQIRPRGWPAFLGLHSENAAHRFAVEWNDDDGRLCEGVFVQRRDTNRRINHWAGGRVFPGRHHLAQFDVVDDAAGIRLAMQSSDALVRIELVGEPTDAWPGDSIFTSLAGASAYFERGSLGYSPSRRADRLDGLRLSIPEWSARPVAVTSARSSFFDDRSNFPRGSIRLDHALLMRHVLHEWHISECLATAVSTRRPA